MIRFPCECGRQLQARPEEAGRPAACPVCGKTTLVPADDPPRPDDGPRGEAIQMTPPTARSGRAGDVTDEPAPRRRRDEGAVEKPRRSGMATAALVLGILSFPCMLAPLTSLPAIILGILALVKVGKSNGRLGGQGSAITGLVLGSLGLLLGVPVVLIGMLVPAVSRVRQAATRMQDANNLKQMAIGMHTYHDVYGGLPAATTFRTKDGKPGLSWRVALLPFLEQQALFMQFHLDEAWDSPHNKQFVAMMPKVYLRPGDQPDGSGMTPYQVFVGPGTVFEPRQDRPPVNGPTPTRGWTLNDITDGASNTLLIVTARDLVVWTKPDDLDYDPNGPLPALGAPYARGFNAAFADGSARFLSDKLPESTLRLLITRNDGQPIPPLP